MSYILTFLFGALAGAVIAVFMGNREALTGSRRSRDEAAAESPQPGTPRRPAEWTPDPHSPSAVPEELKPPPEAG